LQSPVAGIGGAEAHLQVFVLLHPESAHAVDVVRRTPAWLIVRRCKRRYEFVDREVDGQRGNQGRALNKVGYGADSCCQICIIERTGLGMWVRVFDVQPALCGVWAVEEILAREHRHRIRVNLEFIGALRILRQLDFKTAIAFELDVPVIDVQGDALGEFAMRLTAVETKAQVTAVEALAADDVLLITSYLREIVGGIDIVSEDFAHPVGKWLERRSQRIVEKIEVCGHMQHMKNMLVAIGLALIIKVRALGEE